jgi:predicted membrane channel-forming protein YqfA (hemolysin III family)
MMNAAHLHLISTHLPVVGAGFGFCLLLWSLVRRSEELKDISLVVFVLAALLSIPAYLSGRPAEALIKGTPGLVPELIEQHAELALVAFVGMGVLGVTALAGLIAFRSPKVYPRWFMALVVLLALAVGGLMGWTSNLGGKVRHPEIRAGESSGLPR